jgi:hypothetical protein
MLPTDMLAVIDVALTVIHTAVVLASLCLWIPARTRRMHLALVALVAASWLCLGPLLGRGLGYCALTDVHWQLKHALGQTGLPSSFITYLFTLVSIDARAWANTVTALTFAFVCVASFLLEVHSRLRRSRVNTSSWSGL